MASLSEASSGWRSGGLFRHNLAMARYSGRPAEKAAPHVPGLPASLSTRTQSSREDLAASPARIYNESLVCDAGRNLVGCPQNHLFMDPIQELVYSEVRNLP